MSLAFTLGISLAICVPRVAAEKHFKECKWRPEIFFTSDSDVDIARAIMRHDSAGVERLINRSNANHCGQDGMNFLFLSLFSRNLQAFRFLLIQGADPNRCVSSNFNNISMPTGISVSHAVCKYASFRHFFDLVFSDNGMGDANVKADKNLFLLAFSGRGMTPIFQTFFIDDHQIRRHYINRLIKKGAKMDIVVDDQNLGFATLNHRTNFPAVLDYVENGLDPFFFYRHFTLMHAIINREASCPDDQRDDFNKLVSLLESKGDSMKAAKADLARWRNMGNVEDETEKIVVMKRLKLIK